MTEIPRPEHPEHPEHPEIDWKSVGLGERVDSEIASELGVPVRVVAHHRQKLGIHAWKRNMWRWTPEHIALLGSASDHDVARRIGTTHHTVERKRALLGIAPFEGHWTPDRIAKLGTMTDVDLASEMGITAQSVQTARVKRGIDSFTPSPDRHIWTDADRALLGTMTDQDLAQRLGVSRISVRQQRVKAGKKPFDAGSPWTPEALAKLGKVHDAQVAAEVGLATSTVASKRLMLGIPLARELHRLGRNRTFDPETIERLVAGWNAGLHVWEIADACQMSDETVRKYARTILRHRCKRRESMRGRDWTEQDDATLRKLYEQGRSVASIVELLERTRPAVLSRICNLGLRRPLMDTDRLIIDGLAAGRGITDIAKDIGVEPAQIYVRMGRMRREGVSVPRVDRRESSRRREAAFKQSILARHNRPLAQPALDLSAMPWLAGVFDISGSMNVKTKCVDRLFLDMQLDTSRRAIVEQVFLATGIGHVDSYVYGRSGKVRWRWRTTSREDVLPLIRAIEPHLRVRRDIAKAMLQWPATTYPLTPEAISARQKIMEEVRYLSSIEDLPQCRDEVA